MCVYAIGLYPVVILIEPVWSTNEQTLVDACRLGLFQCVSCDVYNDMHATLIYLLLAKIIQLTCQLVSRSVHHNLLYNIRSSVRSHLNAVARSYITKS